MKPTQHKIICTAIRLFNQQGTANVRVQDIAVAADISPGNLTYHFKSKQRLMLAVIEYVQMSLSEMAIDYNMMTDAKIWVGIVQNYLRFQTRFRFFYRDTLVIIRHYPDARQLYHRHLQRLINHNKNAIFLAVGHGFIKPEPHDGHYEIVAKNTWSVLHSWLTECEIMNNQCLDYHKCGTALLEMHYPYFTDKGLEFYQMAKQQLPIWNDSWQERDNHSKQF